MKGRFIDRGRFRSRLGVVGVTAVILSTGWLAGPPVRPVRADGGSRAGESSSVAGPIEVQPTPDGKMQVPLDATYWIDYGSAKLYAMVPSSQSTPTEIKILRAIAERDLVADFGLKPDQTPHFLLNTVSLGAMLKGSSVLTVIETTSRQVAVYQATPRTTGLESALGFRKLQVVPYGRPGDEPAETIAAVGSLVSQQSRGDRAQTPLQVLHWLENRPIDAGGPTLYAAVPAIARTASGEQVLSAPSGRDLAADFKLPPGASPRFLMNTPSLGSGGFGASVLLLFETTTKQVAAYRVSPVSTISGGVPGTKAEMALLDLKEYDRMLPQLPSGTRAD